MPRARIARSAGALLIAFACASLAPSANASPRTAARFCPAGYAYAGVYTDYSYETCLCPLCGEAVDDDRDEYLEVGGAPWGRPDLSDVRVHARCATP